MTASALPDTPVVLDRHGKPINIEYFWTEGCAAFALVLAARLRRLGVAADLAVISKSDGEPWSEDHCFEFTHVVVSVADGYVDAKGFADGPFTVAERLGLAARPNDIDLHGDWTPDDFVASFVGFDVSVWARHLELALRVHDHRVH